MDLFSKFIFPIPKYCPSNYKEIDAKLIYIPKKIIL